MSHDGRGAWIPSGGVLLPGPVVKPLTPAESRDRREHRRRFIDPSTTDTNIPYWERQAVTDAARASRITAAYSAQNAYDSNRVPPGGGALPTRP
jgi:hypothetical protein